MSKVIYIHESQACPEGYKDSGLTRETRARAAGGSSARQRICIKETVKVSELDDLFKGFGINNSSNQTSLSSLFSGKPATKGVYKSKQPHTKKTIKSKASKRTNRTNTTMRTATRKPKQTTPEGYEPIEEATDRNIRKLTRQMKGVGESEKNGESDMFAVFRKSHAKNNTKKNKKNKKNKNKNNSNVNM